MWCVCRFFLQQKRTPVLFSNSFCGCWSIGNGTSRQPNVMDSQFLDPPIGTVELQPSTPHIVIFKCPTSMRDTRLLHPPFSDHRFESWHLPPTTVTLSILEFCTHWQLDLSTLVRLCESLRFSIVLFQTFDLGSWTSIPRSFTL